VWAAFLPSSRSPWHTAATTRGVISKERLALFFCLYSTNTYQGLPPLPPSSHLQPNLESTTGQYHTISTSFTGHKLLSTRLARALMDVMTVRKQDIQGSINKAQYVTLSFDRYLPHLRYSNEQSNTTVDQQHELRVGIRTVSRRPSRTRRRDDD